MNVNLGELHSTIDKKALETIKHMTVNDIDAGVCVRNISKECRKVYTMHDVLCKVETYLNE